jgi:NADH-quinone oxidoreductase subunit C
MFGATKGSDTTGYGGLVAPILFPGAAERPYGGYFDESPTSSQGAVARFRRRHTYARPSRRWSSTAAR